jgi:8-oxo-dGTP pyrophosphatase MutT (NUDIX family)
MALREHGRAHPDRAAIVARMLELLEVSPDVFARSYLDPGHFTASAFVLCPEGRRLLMVHHRKLGRWLQPGGHIEPSDESLHAAARREALEETGVSELEPLGAGIFDVDIHPIPASPREGAHSHFDVRYAFRARTEGLVAAAEVQAARWVELDEVRELNPEESVIRGVERLRLR